MYCSSESRPSRRAEHAQAAHEGFSFGLQQHGAERADHHDRERGRLHQRRELAAVERVADGDAGQGQGQPEQAG
jgi:hypothetical protein